MIALDKRIKSLTLYMERTERVMNLIRLDAPPWLVAWDMKLVSESATELKGSLKEGDAENVIKIAYEMYLDQGEDEDV